MMVMGVMGVLLSDRREQAPRVQDVLTEYGDLILCRSGVHDPAKARGLITLMVEAPEKDIDALAVELEDISGVEVSIAFF